MKVYGNPFIHAVCVCVCVCMYVCISIIDFGVKLVFGVEWKLEIKKMLDIRLNSESNVTSLDEYPTAS
jgi:cytochrome bd-type quinol oxidase subunit 2